MDRAPDYTDADHIGHNAASALERWPGLRSEALRLRLDPEYAGDPLARLRLERALAGVALGDLRAEDIPALTALPEADLDHLIDAAAAHTARTERDGLFYVRLLAERWSVRRLLKTLPWVARRINTGGVDDAVLDELADALDAAGAAIGWTRRADWKRGAA